jgi:hypothetical protein
MNIKTLKLSVTILLCLSMNTCRTRDDESTSSVSTAKDQSDIRVNLAAFFRPESFPPQKVTIDAANKLLVAQRVPAQIPADARSLELLEGETLFFVDDPSGIVPLVSIQENQVFAWSTVAPMSVDKNGSAKVRDSNLAYRHMAGSDIDSSSVPYFIYRAKSGQIFVSKFSDHSLFSTRTLRRYLNQFYDEQGEKIFEFESAGQDMWRLSGNWDDGFLCDGSVIWKSGASYYSATKRFGIVTKAHWEDSGDQMQMVAISQSQDIPAEAAKSLRSCAGGGANSVQELIAGLQYETGYSPVAADAQAVEYDFNPKSFALGKKVRFKGNNSIWVLLEHLTPSGIVTVANYSRTIAADKGRTLNRIYTVRKKGAGAAEIKELAVADRYLVAAAARIQENNEERVASISRADQYLKRQQEYMRIAEARANFVGAGFNEFYKPVINIFATAAMDLTFRAPATDQTVLGVKLGKNSLAGATIELTSRKDRLIAGAYTTALQGLLVSAPVAAATFDTKTLQDHIFGTGTVLGNIAVAQGLRSWYPASNRWSYPLVAASGIVSRWRKMDIESQIGLENRNQALNLIAGGASAISTTLATPKGPGVTGAVWTAGNLISEIISGRGTPGVIIGSSIEAGTNLFVKHPAIRPFALTLAGQLSALAQIGDAWRVGYETSEKLEAIRLLKVEQVQKYNAVLYLLRSNDGLLSSLSAPESQIVSATLQDPYAGFRKAF